MDRETPGYTARDFIEAIVRGSCGNGKEDEEYQDELKESEWKKYITHVVYLEGPGTPAVDKVELKRLGIEAVRVYGRRAEPEGVMLKNPVIDAVKGEDELTSVPGHITREDIAAVIGESAGMRYDSVGLGGALNAILGGKTEKTRRYTNLS